MGANKKEENAHCDIVADVSGMEVITYLISELRVHASCAPQKHTKIAIFSHLINPQVFNKNL
jgi:hypothetical protein